MEEDANNNDNKQDQVNGNENNNEEELDNNNDQKRLNDEEEEKPKCDYEDIQNDIVEIGDKQRNDNADLDDKQQNENAEIMKEKEALNQQKADKIAYMKQTENNGTEDKKTDRELIENLSNDSFDKKFEMLREKFFNRQGRPILPEDRINSKGITANPKLEEIFAMIETKDFRRELRELNVKPDNIPADNRVNKFDIRSINNYTPQNETKNFSQGKEKKTTYPNIIHSKNTNNNLYNNLQFNIQTISKASDNKREKRLSSPVVIEKIIPRKRDVLFTKDYFRAELTSLNEKLFGNERIKGRKAINQKENFLL